ncbi:MAG: hypothetical protein A2Y14_00980 [Verrucomicrobia bacterium GWF2_51_19]|nr:MAG: hypothetical protein A2Y14_00980 [Verrucomicrobia bacterium GWF2_51_19]HCJ12058.1 ATP-dependent RecD-like DNA helicase [Opitutae bacterium]
MELGIQVETEHIKGVLERILYMNEENHYTVAELVNDKEKYTVTGLLPGVQCGETLRAWGTWTDHKRFGKQFKIERFESMLPATVNGIRKYLASGLIHGIGKTYADKIVDTFGEDTLRIISEESGRLQEISGIGKQRAKSIKKSWEEQQSIRNIMIFLQAYGVTTSQCLRLVKTYGQEARTILEQNPYQMANDIRGIGFKTADQIALNLGFPNDGEARILAGLRYCLSEFEARGHTGAAREELEHMTAEVLEVDLKTVEGHFPKLLETQEVLTFDNDFIQSFQAAESENEIAHALNRLLSHPSKLPAIQVDKAVDWGERKAGIVFAPEQRDAVFQGLGSKFSVLTGGPGTGKTTLLRVIVAILQAKDVYIQLAAPTGRAAQRMKESTGLEAQTIHRLLKFDPLLGHFVHDEETPLSGDFIIVDEVSMLDIHLASALLKAIPDHAHVLFVGDVDQLPSIGPGTVLKDLIESQKVPVTRLSHIFRQGKRSTIVTVAHNILQGTAALPNCVKGVDEIDPDKDFTFVQCNDPEDCVKKVHKLCGECIPAWYKVGYMDYQVLAPIHKGTGGIENFNTLLQSTLNTSHPDPIVGPQKFRVADKIIQTRNNYEKNVFNGDIGQIGHIDIEKKSLRANFDKAQAEFDLSDITDLSLAYAISIHKSQGSEFPIVVIPLLKQHFILLQRNLLYTAVTRGRHRVFIVGELEAYRIALSKKESFLRKTTLQRRLNTMTHF